MRYVLTAAIFAALSHGASAQEVEAELGAAPQAAGPQETLQEALAAAYVNNPTLEAARAQARAVDEQAIQARATFLPNVNLTGAYVVGETDADDLATPSPADRLTSDRQNGTYGLAVSQELFAGGRRLGQAGVARAAIAQAQEALRATEQAVLLQAVAAYRDVQREQEVVRIAENNVQVLTRQLQAARDRFEVGEITRTDVAQAQARLALGQSNLATARSNLEASRATYAEIIGRPPGTLAPAPPLPALPQSLDEAIEQGLELNPDLRRLRQNERGARSQVRVEAAGLAPSLSVVGRLERSENYLQTDGLGREADSATATAQLSIPLFEGGFNWSRVRQARSNVERARSQVEEARRGVIGAVTTAWHQFAATQRVIESSREQEAAAALALQGAEEELKVGLRTTLDVLDAQQEFLNAQLAVVRAERDAYVAAHALLQAIGRLDAETLGVEAPRYDPERHRRATRWRIIGGSPPR